jgi:hypothetical protein
MQQINKRLLAAMAVLVLVCGVSLSGSALAEQGSDSGSASPNSGSGSSGSSGSSTSTTPTKTEPENETEVENHAHDLAEQFRQQGRAKVKEVFDKIYTKVKAFHDSKNLNTTDYAALTAKVDTAQADADAKIAALKSLDVTVDCAQTNVADGVSAFRAATSSTRDSLKAYRKALTALIVAVHQSAESTSPTDNSSSN